MACIEYCMRIYSTVAGIFHVLIQSVHIYVLKNAVENNTRLGIDPIKCVWVFSAARWNMNTKVLCLRRKLLLQSILSIKCRNKVPKAEAHSAT